MSAVDFSVPLKPEDLLGDEGSYQVQEVDDGLQLLDGQPHARPVALACCGWWVVWLCVWLCTCVTRVRVPCADIVDRLCDNALNITENEVFDCLYSLVR